MRRRLLNLLTALSLQMCLGVCVPWVRSYWWADSVAWGSPRALRGLLSSHGGIYFGTSTVRMPAGQRRSTHSMPLNRHGDPRAADPPHGMAGFRYGTAGRESVIRSRRQFHIPHS